MFAFRPFVVGERTMEMIHNNICRGTPDATRFRGKDAGFIEKKEYPAGGRTA
jgi:hypothetical protein